MFSAWIVVKARNACIFVSKYSRYSYTKQFTPAIFPYVQLVLSHNWSGTSLRCLKYTRVGTNAEILR